MVGDSVLYFVTTSIWCDFLARFEMNWKRQPKHVEAMMEDGTKKVYENVRIHQIFNGPYYFYDENGKKVKLQPLSLILDYTGKDFEDNKQWKVKTDNINLLSVFLVYKTI